MSAVKKFILPVVIAVTIAVAALGAGWFSRPFLDDDLVSKEFLVSEESPVVVIEKKY